VSCILALDQGTTSSRAIVFDRDGHIAAVAQPEFAQLFPRPGWVEHDPDEIWATQIAVATEALGRAQRRPCDVAAIGITNQRETTIVWDRKTGRPVYNAIVWQDRRTAEFCDRLKRDGHERLIRDRTGLDAYFSGSKVAWNLDNVPGVRVRAEAGELAFGTVRRHSSARCASPPASRRTPTAPAVSCSRTPASGRWLEEPACDDGGLAGRRQDDVRARGKWRRRRQ
jgi:glycerol kinase